MKLKLTWVPLSPSEPSHIRAGDQTVLSSYELITDQLQSPLNAPCLLNLQNVPLGLNLQAESRPGVNGQQTTALLI